jgi:hypothetical protein
MPTRRAWAVASVIGVLLLAACSSAEGAPTPAATRTAAPRVTTQAPPVPTLATDRQRDGGGVIASGGRSAPYNYGPTVLQDGNAYRMWWCSQLPGVGTLGDDVLTSAAGSLDGPFAEGSAVFHGTGTGFDAVHTCDPSVLKVNGTYLLYYTGSPGEGNGIGLASSPDGVTWTRVGGGPIVTTSFDTNRANNYGVGQPSVVFLDGWFYLMFTDTTGKAAGPNGEGQFVLRAQDPAFVNGAESLTPAGFTPLASTKAPRTVSIAAAFSADWMWVDALGAFAVAHEVEGAGTVLTFWDRDFTGHPYADVVVAGPWQEGPGLVRRADGHAPVSADDPCGRVPVDVVRATRERTEPTDLRHFGLDLVGVKGCRAPATLDGFAVPAPDRTMNLVVAGQVVRVDRRAVAEQLAVKVLDQPADAVNSLPVAARITPGATVVRSPNRLAALLLAGSLWPIGAAPLAESNSSPVVEVTDQQWDTYPKGSDLSVFRR